eukprot:Phypoly_transcript_05829.p1 GENE.Phypoly_transcript_05829~~Phypoly_transcript_05829.p1  ORF type:complete len:609 (+),score=103.80 Phypoly_transcript_05829:262-1827(+)
MNIKLVLYNASKNTFKLKNHKEDVGECVMRRQTWSGVSDVVWRRSEYKLMNKLKSNGKEELVVQDFPVLIHYFIQNNTGTVTVSDNPVPTPIINIPLKLEENELEDDIYALPATSPSSTVDTKRKFETPTFAHDPSSTSSTTQEFIQNFWEDQVDPNSVPMSPTQLLNIFTQTESLTTLAPQFTYTLPPAYQPKVLYPQLDSNAQTAEIRTYSPDSGPMQDGAKVLICVHGFSFFDQYLFPQSPAPSPYPSTSQQTQQTPQQNKGGIKSRKKTATSSPSSVAHPTTMSHVSNNNVYYYSFWCVFDFGVEVPATPIAPGVVEVQAPARTEPGPVKFWLLYKENSSKKILQISNQALFHYLPTDDKGKVSVCMQRVIPTTSPIDEIASKYKYTARDLDLSHNNLFNVQFLTGFFQLHTLQLDHNSITSQTTFPHLPSIHTLSLRYNVIRTLEPFIVNLSWSFPSMVRLDLEGNEAAPSRAKPHFHYNYRIYCISKLKRLTSLDSYDVTIEEKQHASWIANEEK